MKINKSKSSLKNRIIACVILLLVVVIGYSLYAQKNHTWPFNAPTLTTENTTPADDKETVSDRSDSVDSTGQSAEKDDDQQDTDYINPPIENPPKLDDAYPVQNSHYKIAQSSQTKYHITLYPIANNPEYSNYDAQLKDYKEEALDYLSRRYGNTDNLTIEWTPAYAKDI